MDSADIVTIRPLRAEDSIPMYQLRCSDSVAGVSLNPPPTMERHTEFMRRTLLGEFPPIYVADVDGQYAGSVSVARDYTVSVMVASSYRRQGIASMLLNYVQLRHRHLLAFIHKGNTGSLALFIRCGFVPLPPNDGSWRILVWLKEDDVRAGSSTMA